MLAAPNFDVLHDFGFKESEKFICHYFEIISIQQSPDLSTTEAAMDWVIARGRYGGGKGGLWQPESILNRQMHPLYKTTTRLCPCQQPLPLQPRLERVYLFLSAKNVPAALSNGQGGGREKKTEIKQKEELVRERGGTGACLAQEQWVMRLRHTLSLSQQQPVVTDT